MRTKPKAKMMNPVYGWASCKAEIEPDYVFGDKQKAQIVASLVTPPDRVVRVKITEVKHGR
jgi:hypothetical protein